MSAPERSGWEVSWCGGLLQEKPTQECGPGSVDLMCLGVLEGQLQSDPHECENQLGSDVRWLQGQM